MAHGVPLRPDADALPAGLLAVLTAAVAELTRRLAIPVPGAGAAVDDLVAALQDVFGAGQPAVPRLVIDAATAAAAVPGLAAGDRFLAVAPDLAADWLDDSAAVRTNTGLLVNALQGCDALSAGAGLAGGWRILDPPAGTSGNKSGTLPGWTATLAAADLAGIAPAETLVVHAAGPFSPVAGSTLAGLLVDTWVEVVPQAEAATSVAYQADAPTARAPQAILLGLAPDIAKGWNADLVADLALEALSLARLRTVDAETAAWLGRMLPAVVLPDGDAADVIGAPGPAAAAGEPCPAGRGPGEQQGAWLMGSIVNHRLEASTRGTDLLPGLQAHIHDPLWLLARQWQLGELDGSDGGTPVSAALVTGVALLTRWQPDGGQPAPYPRTVPLEALAESDGGPMPWRDTVGAGLRLARALRRAGINPARLIAAHPLAAPDPAVDPDVSPDAHATSSVTPGEVAAVGAVSAGRVPDPAAVAAAFDANRAALVSATGGAAAAVTTVLTAWRAWWDTRQPRPSGAWRPAELSYSFIAATDDPAAPLYSAQRFGGGMLDWAAFDVTAPDEHSRTATATAPPASPASPTAPGASAPASGSAPTAAAGTGTASAPAGVITRSIPVPVAFHGSAAGRYWQLEDASTDLGAIDTFPTELGKLLVAEFTACFAGDWYRVPVRVPYGSAVKIRALVTTDTFGSSVLVPSAGAAARPAAVADVRTQPGH